MIRTEEQKLPNGWTWATVAEITYVNPRAFDIEPGDKDLVSFVPMASVEAGTGRLDATLAKPWETVKKGYTRFQEGDVLFAKITPCMENGKFTVAKGLMNGRGAGSTEFHVLRPTSGILPHYILHYVLQTSLRKEAQGHMKGTAGQLRVPIDFLITVEIPLAPLPEQHRIVAEIETQFSRLDAVVTALKRVQANLKRYRASVLQAACAGCLVPTEAELARAEGRTYESADQLLQRILQERHVKWESEQLASMKAEGKVHKDDRWKSKYREPAKPDVSELPELPEGWAWVKVEQLVSPKPRSLQSGPFGSNLLHSEFQDTGVLAIGIDNVYEGRFSTGRQHRISLEKYAQLEKYTARPLDVLVTVMATVGRCCVVPANLEPAIITKHVYRISANQDIVDPHYLMTALWGGAEVRRQIFSQVQGQTRPGINGEILNRIAIPIPPLTEQHCIVAEVERRLSVIDELEAVIATNLKRADRLRQAILKRAFEGKLVPQDPTDEPASELLERIRTECQRPTEQPKATPQQTNAPQPTGQPKATAPIQGELALGFPE
jgi:type I restriction enzyme, S subunit